MKSFKKVISIALTLMMLTALMAGGLTARAVGGTADVIIHPPTTDNLSIDGKSFTLYQIFEVDVTLDTSDEIIYYEYAHSGDNFKMWPVYVAAHHSGDHFYYGANIAEYINGAVPDWLSFGKELLDYILDSAAHPFETHVTFTATGASGKAIFSGVPYGYYMLVGSGMSKDGNNVEVQSFYTFLTVPAEGPISGAPGDGDVDIYLKADAPAIDKWVKNHELHNNGAGGPGGKNGWDKWTDKNIGEIVEFQHISHVPEMEGYDRYWFIVHDSMSKGLTLDEDSFEIYLGGDSTPLFGGPIGDDFDDDDYDYIIVMDTSSGDYNFSGTLNDGATFAIIFNPDIFVHFTPGALIEINYSAVLNDEAVIAGTGNPNKVYLEYSNNPYAVGDGDIPDETGETPEDEVWVYTFELDIYKYTAASSLIPLTSGTPVEGTTFELYRGDHALNEKVEFVLVSTGDATDPTIYRVAMEDDTTTVTEIETPESGLISIIGLDADEYYLHETDTPTLYNIDDTYHKIEIENVGIDSSHEVSYEINEESAAGWTTVHDSWLTVPADINIFNGIGDGKFPETGGIGRTIFIVAGIALMLGATVALTVRRKIRKMVI